MAKIKKLTRKHRLPRWMRRLLGIPVEPVEFETLRLDCPLCGTRKYMKIPKTRPDGRTIAQTIIDEVPQTDFQKKAVEFLKEVAPNLPEAEYKITAYELEKMEVVTSEEHLKKHQIRRL